MSTASNIKITNDAIQDALQRAKELAAHSNPQKRPVSDDSSNYPAKRVNTVGANGMDMAGGMQISSLGGPPGHLGMPTNGLPPGAGGEQPSVMDTIEVPDHCVGLVIGRGGEQISQIQAQTGCRVQMASESGPNQLRHCQLQGSRMSVDRAKTMINDVIQRAGNRPPPNRPGGGPDFSAPMNPAGRQPITIEIPIPGAKCGLIIGKNGETIKSMQEQAGVKMVMIQENQEAGQMPKPLRISGDPEKVENARRLIEEILQSREDHPPVQQRYGMPGQQYGGAAQQRNNCGEVIVPRSSVGMIIGKGGETIKRLAAESGAKIQFKPDDDPSTQDRVAMIQGTRDQIEKATQLIANLVDRSGSGVGADVFYMHVPANKTGLVIGKGGETIKGICAESGAHVELSRDPPRNSAEKVFVIRGSPAQIHHAKHIIKIKVGDLSPGTPLPPFMAGPGDQFGVGHNAGAPGGPPNYGNGNTQFVGAGVGAPQPAGQWGGNFAHQQQPGGADPGQPSWPPQPTYGQQYQQPAQTGYQQPGAPAPVYGQQMQQPMAQPQPAQAVTAPTVNPTTGQPDYSAQWAEYYRNMGMHDQAALIEEQLKRNAVAIVPQPAAQAQSARPAQPAYGGYGAQPAASQNQFSYGGPQQGAQPQAGYQFPQQY